MMKSVQTNKIGFLGEDFQYKLVHEFIEDKEFFKDLCDIVDQNLFTDPNLKTIVGVMRDYYKREQNVPNYDLIKIELSNKAHNTAEAELYDNLCDKIHNTSSEGCGRIRELAEKFFKQQNMIRVAHEIINIAGKGNVDEYDKCVNLLNKALLQGTNDDLGTGVFDNLSETLSDDYRIAIPTGIDKIDETLEGGLGKGELGVIVGSSSFGKAQPLDSRILTPNGYKMMGDIKVGDHVIGGDGKQHEVSGVFPQGKRPIYKVHFSNGTSCECDIEHLWNVKDGNDTFNTLTLREIIKKGLIKKGSKKYRFTIPVVNPIEFCKQPIEFDPYLMGCYIGSEGKDFIINECLSEKHIPKEYLFNTVENRIALLQGIMDINGHIQKDDRFRISCKSRQLALDIQFIIRSLGGFADINTICKRNKKRGDKDGNIYDIIISMYNESIPLFRYSKLQNVVKHLTQKECNLFMTEAEYIGEKEAQCIMVDSDEHLYVTEDFIVTHNTSLTTAIAAHAATFRCNQNNNDGYKVLQIVFEDRIKQIQRKHIGRITNIEAKDLSKPDRLSLVKDTIENYPDLKTLEENLRIIRLPSGEKTADDIKRLIIKLRNNGFSPDLVIVDYFECLLCKGESSDDKWEKEGKTMRKFESIAGELNIGIWIPVQGTKDSLNSEVVTMDKAGGSFKKIQIAHIVMSIARTVEDIENNRATIAILKNRAGKAGKVFNNVGFNNGTCRITTDDVDELDSLFQVQKQHEKKNYDIAERLLMQSNAAKKTQLKSS